MTDEREIQEAAAELISLARSYVGEGEPMDITDMGYTAEEMALLRSEMKSIYAATKVVNKALADAWNFDHKYESYDDGANVWYLGRTKGKKIIDQDLFYEWLAEQGADKLRSLFSGYNVKVGGLTPAERDNFLDETAAHDTLTILSKPSKMTVSETKETI